MLEMNGQGFDSPLLHAEGIMKSTNQYVYSDDESYLARLEEEFGMLGRQTKREPGRLIIFALARKKKKNDPRKKRR